ncbi:MAG: ETC complex I subunit [Pseudomonadota bacterium]
MLARIYQPPKSAMQSGKGATRRWVLEFAQTAARKIDPLMGWTSATDMVSGQVKLSFDTKDEAIAYASAHGIAHEVIEPPTSKPVPKAYAENFAFQRRRPWTH